MKENVNTAIITCIDQNYEENLEYDFLETLYHKVHFAGEVIVLDYGMSAEVVERIKKKFPVTIHCCEKELSVFTIRFKHLPGIISSLDEKIKQVMVVDGGDVWFQSTIDPLFEVTKDKIGVVAEDRIVGKDEWTDDIIHNLQNEMEEEVLRVLRGKPVLNAGMICGDRKKITDIYKKVYEDIWKCGMDYFGVDQLFFNYEWYQLLDSERVNLDYKYNYVVISHNEDEYEIKDGVLYDKNGEVIVIVHNAGGNWRILSRPFSNRFNDSEQYFVSNIKKIVK